MPTFTVLNCGTNADRNKRGELVADFGAALAGAEYTNYLINDGPGSSGGNRLPGTFDAYTKNKAPKANAPEWSKTPTKTLMDANAGTAKFTPKGHGVLAALTSVSSKTAKIHGGVTGDGWDDNLRHSIAAIAEVCEGGTGVINMLGWSRGGVTCLRLANWIQDSLGDGFTVNIFAVDPVAGLDAGTKLRDTYEIPGIVQNYVAILALDEARGDFRPQDMSRMVVVNPNRTNTAFLPFPGTHDTVVKEKDANASEVIQMVRALAYRFLVNCGTAFQTPQNTFSTAQACRVYAQMMLKRDVYRAQYKKGVKNSLMGGSHTRTALTNVQSYVRADAGIFINDHHRASFERTYGVLYRYLFTNQMGAPDGKISTTVKADSPIGQAVTQLSQSDPDTFDLLSLKYSLSRMEGMATAAWKIPPPGAGLAGLGMAGFAPTPALVNSLV